MAEPAPGAPGSPDDDAHERLVDILLDAELGGDAPPDLAKRIRKEAVARRRRHAAKWAISGVLAMGAAAAIAVMVWPRPRPVEQVPIAQSSGPERGSKLETRAAPKTLELGGYCRVTVNPDSAITVRGEEKAERIVLARGSVACKVDRNIGTFSVATGRNEKDWMEVAVTGTEFTVEMKGGSDTHKGGEAMKGQQLLVRVVVGSVLVSGMFGSMPIRAGEQGGVIEGIVTGKGDANISVRGDGEKESRKFVPYWRGGMPNTGGGPDKEMVAKIRQTPLQSRVRLTWKFEEHDRVVALEILKRGEGDGERGRGDGERGRGDGERGKGDGERAGKDGPAEKSGTARGVISAKEANWIQVETADGKKERYTPHWRGGMPADGGGLDKEMLKTFASLKKGDHVVVEWVWEERRRAVSVKKVD